MTNPGVDLVVVLRIRPGRTCAESAVLLARARPKSLRPLMRLEKPGVQDIVAALMDEGNHQPLDVSLGQGERRKRTWRHPRNSWRSTWMCRSVRLRTDRCRPVS
ncbi:MAG TPA: hypothetical protein VFZ84_20755 [Burkholderiales bacterium]